MRRGNAETIADRWEVARAENCPSRPPHPPEERRPDPPPRGGGVWAAPVVAVGVDLGEQRLRLRKRRRQPELLHRPHELGGAAPAQQWVGARKGGRGSRPLLWVFCVNHLGGGDLATPTPGVG